MKKVISLVFLVVSLSMAIGVYAQAPPPPNGNGTNPVVGENAPVGSSGGGAPIGSGISLLILLGAAYGGKKVYQVNLESKIS